MLHHFNALKYLYIPVAVRICALSLLFLFLIFKQANHLMRDFEFLVSKCACEFKFKLNFYL